MDNELESNAQLALRKIGAGDGNRTHVASLEGWSSTIELHPRRSVESLTDQDAPCKEEFSNPKQWGRRPACHGGVSPSMFAGTGHVRGRDACPTNQSAPLEVMALSRQIA